jgi:hypothetical protein
VQVKGGKNRLFRTPFFTLILQEKHSISIICHFLSANECFASSEALIRFQRFGQTHISAVCLARFGQTHTAFRSNALKQGKI